jgi:hypothetical protein
MKNFEMLRFVARWSRALPLGLVFWAAPALGRPEYPGEIEKHLDLACPPPCWLCHATAAGGGPVEKPFPLAMLGNGLRANSPETVAPALDAILAKGSAVDSDADGTNDAEELADARNPNINANEENDALACPPEYGCGARVAPAPASPLDGSAVACAVASAAVLVAFGRRRRK